MESWLVGTKLTLVIFVLARWVEAGFQNAAAQIIPSLAYLSVATLYHVVRGRNARRLLLLLSLALPATAAVTVNPDFAFLLPVGIAELSQLLSLSITVPILLSGGLMFLVPTGLWAEYLLCAAFGITLYFLVLRSGTRLNAILRENNALRISGAAREKRLAAGAEYEHQLRRLTQLEERNNLAREVHDRVGHAIAGSVLQLEAASALLPDEPERANRLIRQSVDALREGMESIRGALRGLKPEPEELGVQRLRALLDQFSANSSIQTRLSFSGDLGSISPARWAVIIDNVREALTNVVRHSEAKNVQVSLQEMPKLLKVEVHDDGLGAYSLKKGLGIRGIEERVQQEAGTLIIDGTKGFSVIMIFPRKEPERAD